MMPFLSRGLVCLLPCFTQEKEESEQEQRWLGYFRKIFLAIGVFLGWVVGTFVAAFLCMACFIGLAILWVRGLYGVWEWYRWSCSKPGRQLSKWEIHDGCPVKVMSWGELGGEMWTCMLTCC